MLSPHRWFDLESYCSGEQTVVGILGCMTRSHQTSLVQPRACLEDDVAKICFKIIAGDLAVCLRAENMLTPRMHLKVSLI